MIPEETLQEFMQELIGTRITTGQTKTMNQNSNLLQRITTEPEMRSGKPCIKGTRITVYDVLEHLAGGVSEDKILDFPSLERDDIRAVLAFAITRKQKLVS